ncbi:hypothetical protein NL348_17815, partial [Klebsiella pneumoniae]|nr:hypothetical protein [Klebsiella pneumoniae]MCP6208244.1 hypothetical protein [Klebsiella pneumoniae]
YSAIDQIAQFGLSSLKVIYYSEQLFSLPDWLTRAASGAGQRAGLAGSAYSYVAHLNGPLR